MAHRERTDCSQSERVGSVDHTSSFRPAGIIMCQLRKKRYIIHVTKKTTRNKHDRGRSISTDTIDKHEPTAHDTTSPFVPDPSPGGGGDIGALVVLGAPDRSFELNKLWKKCCRTSCCVWPVGLGLGIDCDEGLPRPEVPVPVDSEPTVRVLRDSFRDVSGPLTLVPRFTP